MRVCVHVYFLLVLFLCRTLTYRETQHLPGLYDHQWVPYWFKAQFTHLQHGDRGTDGSDTSTGKEMPRIPGNSEMLEWAREDLPARTYRENVALSMLWVFISSSQNCEITKFYIFKRPSLWDLTTTALSNSYSNQLTHSPWLKRWYPTGSVFF